MSFFKCQHTLAFIAIISLFSFCSFAFDEELFKPTSKESIESLLKKYKLNSESKFPVKIKENDQTIELLFSKNNKDAELTFNFEKSLNFPFEEKDFFVRIESEGRRDIQTNELIIGIPKTGQIFHLDSNLKITKFTLTKPWNQKKLVPLKDILDELTHPQVIYKTPIKK